jgi:hypothetical protein
MVISFLPHYGRASNSALGPGGLPFRHFQFVVGVVFAPIAFFVHKNAGRWGSTSTSAHPLANLTAPSADFDHSVVEHKEQNRGIT